MKICLLGEYSGNLDEGMRKVSFHLAEELTKRHQVLTLDLRGVFTKTFWRTIKNFNPEIVHYIHGSSIKSFGLLKAVSLHSRDTKTVLSMMHTTFSHLSEVFIPFIKPDLILTQSLATENILKRLRCETQFLPCAGVDIKKFTPLIAKKKEELREKYGVDKGKFVILHIGSIKKGRNVHFLEKLQKENNQIIIVGAISTGVDRGLLQRLMKSGCLVWDKYFEHIEEVYAISDCYMFPTPPVNKINSIELPLSVLEAMACNLPVISTKFGALLRIFEEGDGLIFVDKEEDFIEKLEKIKKDDIDVKTRDKVLPYSWENVVGGLERIYEELIREKS